MSAPPPFPVITYDEARPARPSSADGEGPALIHAFTPREHVRALTEALVPRYGCPYVVHFEDNESVLLDDDLARAAARAPAGRAPRHDCGRRRGARIPSARASSRRGGRHDRADRHRCSSSSPPSSGRRLLARLSSPRCWTSWPPDGAARRARPRAGRVRPRVHRQHPRLEPRRGAQPLHRARALHRAGLPVGCQDRLEPRRHVVGRASACPTAPCSTSASSAATASGTCSRRPTSSCSRAARARSTTTASRRSCPTSSRAGSRSSSLRRTSAVASRDGEEALLLRRGDAAEIFEAVRRLAGDAELRARLG